MTITSQHNHKLKEIRKLRQRRRWRERTRRFVAEGEDLLAAADAAGWQPVERFCAAGSGLPGVEVDAAMLASASGLGSGTRTLAVYEERWAERPLAPLCLYLLGVHDPGNVGTILRSAEAFGASSVVLGPETADPFGLKAVRASMGAVFAVPLVKRGGVDSLPGVRIALVPGEGLPLAEARRLCSLHEGKVSKLSAAEGADPPARPARAAAAGAPDITLLIGGERPGLPKNVIEQADLVAHIPIETDSLNAAMAATIAMYELQTRMAPR